MTGPWSQQRVSAGIRHQIGQPQACLDGVEKVRTMAIETIRHHVLEGQNALLVERADHGPSQLRLGLEGELLRHLALGSAAGIHIGKPRLGQKEPLINQGIALA
jgi:hypothetical protein